MELIDPKAEKYAEVYSSEEGELLSQVNRQTYATHEQPHMLSGHVQGRFLASISKMMQPKYILEIGTFTGYSALCLAEGLKEGAELHTIELRAEDAAISQKNFDGSKYKNKIHLHVGNALEVIPKLNYPWDIVFIDADKGGYIQYYELVFPNLSQNGLILADNVLFHGQVLDEEIKGKNALAIDAFNRHVKNDQRTEQVLLTLRDGVLLIQKKR